MTNDRQLGLESDQDWDTELSYAHFKSQGLVDRKHTGESTAETASGSTDTLAR